MGGELSPAGEPLLQGIRDAIDRYALPGASRSVEVKSGVLGERAEVLGALALVISDTERLRSVGLAAVRAVRSHPSTHDRCPAQRPRARVRPSQYPGASCSGT